MRISPPLRTPLLLLVLVLTAIALPASAATGLVAADWSASSARFDGVLCSVETCGSGAAVLPPGVEVFAWFGGVQGADESVLERALTVPAEDGVELRLLVSHPVMSGNGRDYLSLEIDGREVFHLTEGAKGYGGFVEVRRDLSPWADGGLHLVRLRSQVYGPRVSSFFVAGLEIGTPASLGGIIFEDDFESGDVLSWSSSVSDPECVGDADGDRLLDCFETNDGLYLGVGRTGSDPNNPDTDGDGIDDGDEVLGTLGGLDLPAMGTNPVRKSLLVEFDWFDDNLDPGVCGAHSHRPTTPAIDQLTTAYANGTPTNPDGSTGVDLIADYGQGGPFTGGNLIPDADGVLVGNSNGAEFLNHKATHFAANREGYFHYGILPHRFNTNSSSSGNGEIGGDDFIVSLYCFGTTRNQSHTMMHEIGHNLGLRHGGDTNCNHKPNYNSVMNYRFQFDGVDDICTPIGNLVLNLSLGDRITLDENDLNESEGTCGNNWWDWDGDNVEEPSVTVDINSDDTNQVTNCGGILTVLNDFDDWSNLDFAAVDDGDGAAPFGLEIVDCDNPPPTDQTTDNLLERRGARR